MSKPDSNHLDHSVSDPRDTGSMGQQNPDKYKWHAVGAIVVIGLTLPGILGIIVAALPEPVVHPWAQKAEALGVTPDRIALGETAYKMGCALCHGADANGVARLGKPLRNSEFVQDLDDDALFSVITTGRLPGDPENTTGQAMPARGNMNLGNDALWSVIYYLRTLQDPDQAFASVEDWNIMTGESMAGLMGGSGGIGHDLFVSSCSACHGVVGEGMEGLGKPLSTSEFTTSKTDEELMAFIKTGRPIWDAENTTGVDMPPKGGNPAITDEQINDIIKYIRSLHQ